MRLHFDREVWYGAGHVRVHFTTVNTQLGRTRKLNPCAASLQYAGRAERYAVMLARHARKRSNKRLCAIMYKFTYFYVHMISLIVTIFTPIAALLISVVITYTETSLLIVTMFTPIAALLMSVVITYTETFHNVHWYWHKLSVCCVCWRKAIKAVYTNIYRLNKVCSRLTQ